jgi:hypothetical protein
VPTITCPAGLSVSCANNVPAAASTAVTTADNCSGAVSVVSLGDVITNQICANRFTLVRTYRSSDLCSNTATCSQTITVNDITTPSITCPTNVSVSCASAVPPIATGSVTTSDLCGGTLSVVHLGDITTPGTCANRFSVVRTYQASDVCGNSGTCAQIITVNDLTTPIFTNIPANITVECFLIPAVPQNLTASDNCTGPVTITFLGEIQAAGICPIIYTLTRTWRADDGCGNSSTVSQLVQVQDTYAPQFVIMPANIVRDCNQATNLTDLQAWLDSHGGATVSDCSSITWTYQNSPFNLDTTGCGSTLTKYIRFIATDACGNSSFKDARFTVVDQTPPIFTLLPQNLNIACWMGENGEPQLLDWLDHFGFAAVSD